MVRLPAVFPALLLTLSGVGQELPTDSVPRWRPWLVGSGSTVITAGSWIALDNAWYADYERAPLHAFNDGHEWLGMDKAGHFWSAYNGGSWGHAMLRWSGVDHRRATLYGGCMGLIFLTGVEVLDGTSSGWGFSWWDMAANTGGTGTFIGQQLLWNEQRVRVKLSAHLTHFAAMRPSLLGEGTTERLLKDYNGQTIWLSGNIHAFLPERSAFPKWLSVSVGYGAENMVTAEEDGQNGLRGIGPRRPKFFLSLDADFARIKSRSAFVRTALFLLNSIKVPAPALEWSNGRLLAHGLYF